MKPMDLFAVYVIGLFGLFFLHKIEKNLELIVQRLQWIHEDMKEKNK